MQLVYGIIQNNQFRYKELSFTDTLTLKIMLRVELHCIVLNMDAGLLSPW
jgi:hypothetical protein